MSRANARGNCPNCGSVVSGAGRFCPECGRAFDGEAAEGTAVCAAHSRRRRPWPPDPLLLIAALLAVGGVLLLAGGELAWGLVVILLAALVVLAHRDLDRRATHAALGSLRERLSAHRDVMRARSRGQLDLFRARRERAELEAERNRCYGNLGRAVFEGDETGREAATTALAAIVERIERKEAEIDSLIHDIDERVRRAQAGVAPTEQLEAESPPEPARVPEPYPPPDEGDPPEPAVVPEPSPGGPSPEPEPGPMPREDARRKSA